MDTEAATQPIVKSNRGAGFSDPVIKAKAAATRKRNAEKRKLEELIKQKEMEKAVLTGSKEMPDIVAELPTTLDDPRITDGKDLYPFAGQQEDFFYVDGKDPRFNYYHAGGNNPQQTYRRVQTMKRMGYEVVKEGESSEKAYEQENRSGDMEKTTGIPGHILMRVPIENKIKRDRMKQAENKIFETGLHDQGQFSEMNEMLKQSGIGGSLKQELQHTPQQQRVGASLKDAIKSVIATKGRNKTYFT